MPDRNLEQYLPRRRSDSFMDGKLRVQSHNPGRSDSDSQPQTINNAAHDGRTNAYRISETGARTDQPLSEIWRFSRRCTSSLFATVAVVIGVHVRLERRQNSRPLRRRPFHFSSLFVIFCQSSRFTLSVQPQMRSPGNSDIILFFSFFFFFFFLSRNRHR